MKRTTEILLVLAILAVAAFLRVRSLSTVPALAPQEAQNGITALQQAETGTIRLFHPGRSVTEGLAILKHAAMVKIFGANAFALRAGAVGAALFTILGLYLLVKVIFGSWELAALAGFFMASSLWHLVYSRLGIAAVFAPLLLVWGAYFYWRGLRWSHDLNFAFGGALVGLGTYVSSSLALMPLAFLATTLVHWQAVNRDFSKTKFLTSRIRLAHGFGWFFFALFAVVLPLVVYLAQRPDELRWWLSDASRDFSFWSVPLVYWPVQALIAVGFLRSVIKFFKMRRTHGHFSTAHALVLSWLAAALGATFLFADAVFTWPLVVVPVLYLFAAEGLWWLMNVCEDWYRERDVHVLCLPAGPGKPRLHALCARESIVVIASVVVLFLGALTVAEYDRYFNQWAHAPETAQAFPPRTTEILETIRTTPPSVLKYVVAADLSAAQPLMFLTGTTTAAEQRAQNLFYITEQQYRARQYPPRALILKLE